MSKYVATLTLAANSTPPSAPAEPFSSFTWHMEDDNDLMDFQEAVSEGLIALGRKRAAAANAKTGR